MNCSLEEAIRLIKQGEAVALPTDTVWGVAARLDAVDAIYRIKGRPSNKPLLILGASLDQLEPFIASKPRGFDVLARQHWPGPVTLVVPANLEAVPSAVRAGGTTVGLRIPNCPEALEILLATGPLAAPSANLSGQPPPRSRHEITLDVPILDSDFVGSGQPSTILDGMGGEWAVLR